MKFYNCGASIDGRRVRNKKELRELLEASPVDVYFDGTAIIKDVDGYRGSELPEGVSLSVVLPDPYRDRRYYASVEKKAGKLVVK
jgi:hypothetical protein